MDKYEQGGKFLSLFGHIIRKSAFPRFRLYVNNLCLLKPEVHELFDNAVLDKIIKFEKETGHSFKILFELESLLYNEYKKEIGTTCIQRKIINQYFEYYGK